MLEFLTAALLIQVPGAPSCTTADRRVEEAIVATQRELQGQELCQYRLYETLSDVDGDGVTDFFVVFTIEGAHGSATNSIQFLGMFASGTGWRPVVTEVGRRGTRVVQAIHVAAGAVELGTLEYASSDPMCCPSRHGKLRLAVKDGKISQVGG